MISGKFKGLDNYIIKDESNPIVVKSKKESLIGKAMDKARSLKHII